MSGSSSKAAPATWKNLMLLGQKQGSIKLKDLSREMDLSEEESMAFLRQIFPDGIGAEIYFQENEVWVDINANAIQYMLPLSPAEWIQLHQLLAVTPASNPALSMLKKKVTENGPIKVVMELLGQLDLWEQKLTEQQQEMITVLDSAIADKKPVLISVVQGKKYTVFPCKVVHLEGQLSLIAEDFHDHCLIVISLKDLVDVHVKDLNGTSRVAHFEIEEFIAAIRAMNEKETRLILKIHDPQSVNLFPDHHFLGKPCMITNPNGDLIWAAYVEACDPLYDWILSLGSHAEILDPVKFKDEYISYCEAKIRKVA
ncbi:MAG TPA: WYL domain-containing protein [Bacteriovoracaceae bacterium]|nr:WYL domain-containing protein [Bacteriovoracaceae bacterium]